MDLQRALPDEESKSGKQKSIDECIRDNGLSIEQFKVLDRNIGRGTYGEVKLVERDGKRYALKTLSKDEITRVSRTSTKTRVIESLIVL